MSDKPNYQDLGAQVRDGIYKEELATEPPKCMKQINQLEVDPAANNLTKEEYKNAVSELYKRDFLKKSNFPKHLKQRNDPPINGQVYCLHTFIPSEGAKPDSDGCYGVLKIRGCFSNVNECDEHAEKIIRTVDSYNENFIGHTGRFFPLTLNSNYCQETKEIDLLNKMDEIAKANAKKQKEKEEKDIEEIKEKERKLLSESKEEYSTESLDHYTTLRVKLANVKYAKDEIKKKEANIFRVEASSEKDVKELDEKYPEYRVKYMEQYVDALAKSGVDLKQNPLIKYMSIYDEEKLASEVNKLRELNAPVPTPEQKTEESKVEESKVDCKDGVCKLE